MDTFDKWYLSMIKSMQPGDEAKKLLDDVMYAASKSATLQDIATALDDGDLLVAIGATDMVVIQEAKDVIKLAIEAGGYVL